MAVDVKLVVTDASPLITLAAAQSLDYLLYPALPVIIPDAVYYEATGSAGKLGARRIIDRYHALSDDRDVRRMMVLDPDRLILLTTWDYLRQLELAQRI